MAEKTDKKEQGAPAAGGAGEGAASGKPSVLRSSPVMLGVVMVVEAAVIFAGVKIFGGGPPRLAGADMVLIDPNLAHANGNGTAPVRMVELPVLEFRAINKRTGRTFLYDVSIYIMVKAQHREQAEQTLKDREAMIRDRIRTIIAQSDPEKLGGGIEPGLETLRRQVKYQLDEIVGEGIIEEVLVPRCIPYRAD